MGTASVRVMHKHFRLDNDKIKHAQELLGTSTETETIERALDEVIAQRERNNLVWEAHERFANSGTEIRDVYGKLDG